LPLTGTGQALPSLPGARREVQTIASQWGRRARLLVGREASEAAVLRLAPGADVLHLATHAVIDERSPLSSAVVLAPDEDDGGHNGLLQAWEIIERLRLDLPVVTLSGCQTGLGRELNGEGLLGLTRAFELAGARAVLLTLWRVEDRAQAELMVEVYAGLREGLRLDEAVRRAQLSFLAAATRLPATPTGAWQRLLAFARLLPDERADLSHPFYWAALRVDGDAR
jgi:CHAT domain-containing protein